MAGKHNGTEALATASLSAFLTFHGFIGLGVSAERAVEAMLNCSVQPMWCEFRMLGTCEVCTAKSSTYNETQ